MSRPAADPLRGLLAGAFDHYAARTVGRLAGLTDHEWLWEPAEGCWTVRDGVADSAWPPPEPSPVTTIAWRLAHICSFLQEHELATVAFGRPMPASVVAPRSAAEALAALDVAIAAWKSDLASIDDDRLWSPIGPEAGHYGDQPVASFVEHIHDEFVHHSAEVGTCALTHRPVTVIPSP